MKKTTKLMAVVIILIRIAIINDVNAQGNVQAISTNNFVMKFTNSSATTPTAGNSVMQENSSNIGIGLSPSFKLDVTGGDINLNTSTSSYRLSNGTTSDKILWHSGNQKNIFVGVGAGNNSITASSANTTLVGYNAGNTLNNSGLWNNSFIGSYSGSLAYTDNTIAVGCSYNTGVGAYTLQNTLAYGGSALGYLAGMNNMYGCSITAVGERAMQYNTNGNDNCAFGHHALISNKSLSSNVAIGSEALSTQDFDPADCSNSEYEHGCVGSYNVAVGNEALFTTNPTSVSADTLQNGMNNTAIGHGAGYINATGFNNSFLGFGADVSSSNLTT